MINQDYTDLDGKLLPSLLVMTREIQKHRKRLGGDWAVAQAVITRFQREAIRKKMGKDLIFIVLNMNKGNTDCINIMNLKFFITLK